MARSHAPVRGAARNLRAPMRTRLHVEQLEARNLLSTQALGDLTVSPALDFTPLATNTAVQGLTPARVRHAYGFDRISFNGGQVPANGSGGTIAVISSYSDPNIASDLAVFDRTFGLPDPPSFTIANPSGAPAAEPDPSWNLETALDVEWAHAMAPGANILLVQAPTASMGYLLNAVNYARNVPGVVAVSMSWGVSEFAIESYLDGYFATPAGHIGGSGLPGGVTFVAASGDAGAFQGGTWPSVSPNVLAVGGSQLSVDAAGNYVGETGWTYSGAAISQYETKPLFQSPFQQSTKRTTPDVAYVGDPTTGVAVYSSADFYGHNGWFTMGGTSAGAPQWAGLIAVADQGRALEGMGSLDHAASMLYNAPVAFHNIPTGYNGFLAGPGYNLVTGLGSPYADRIVNFLTTGGLYTSLNTTPIGTVSLAALTGTTTTFEAVEMPAETAPVEMPAETGGSVDAFALVGLLDQAPAIPEVLAGAHTSSGPSDSYFAEVAAVSDATTQKAAPMSLHTEGGRQSEALTAQLAGLAGLGVEDLGRDLLS